MHIMCLRPSRMQKIKCLDYWSIMSQGEVLKVRWSSLKSAFMAIVMVSWERGATDRTMRVRSLRRDKRRGFCAHEGAWLCRVEVSPARFGSTEVEDVDIRRCAFVLFPFW